MTVPGSRSPEEGVTSAPLQHETWSGLAVRLFWSGATSRVQISAADQVLDAEPRIDVAGACALDAFYDAAGALGFGRANNKTSTSNRPERSAAR